MTGGISSTEAAGPYKVAFQVQDFPQCSQISQFNSISHKEEES